MSEPIDFQTQPEKYRHWRVDYEGDIAKLTMDVDENGGLFEGYELKLNSYDLGGGYRAQRHHSANAI